LLARVDTEAEDERHEDDNDDIEDEDDNEVRMEFRRFTRSLWGGRL
jgi:hypothetical protein